MFSKEYKWHQRKDQQSHWVFKRIVNSAYKQHLVFQKIAQEEWNRDNVRRKIRNQKWSYYEGEKSLDEYYQKMEGNWDNPWIQ